MRGISVFSFLALALSGSAFGATPKCFDQVKMAIENTGADVVKNDITSADGRTYVAKIIFDTGGRILSRTVTIVVNENSCAVPDQATWIIK